MLTMVATENIIQAWYSQRRTQGGENVYPNLLSAMETKNITFSQMADLLGCRYQTVSDNIRGNTEKGIYFDDAKKIWKVFFPEYDFMWLFLRNKNSA